MMKGSKLSRCIIAVLTFIVAGGALYYACRAGLFPVWLGVVLYVLFTDVLLVFISCFFVEDLVLPDDYVRSKYCDYFSAHPGALEHLDEIINEPEEYDAQLTPIEELLSSEDPSLHTHLTGSRRTDREILRLCANDSFLCLSFGDIARKYGITEDDLILFLYSRRPKTLFRRVYYRSLLATGAIPTTAAHS